MPGLTGPRTLVLGGGVGAATGSEAIFVNPAAMAARKRYVMDGLYLFDSRPGAAEASARHGQYFGGALADSQSTELAAGLAFLHASKGPQTGNVVHLALGGPLASGLLVGVTGKYYALQGVEKAKSTLNMDAGVFWQITSHVSVGGAGYNLVGSSKDFTTPQEFGAGIAVGSDTSLQLTADWRVNTEACFLDGKPHPCSPPSEAPAGMQKRSASRYGGAIEYLVDGVLPLRAGFQLDDVSKTKWWSAGLGLVSAQAALDIGYRQSLDKSSARTVIVAVRGFLPNE